MRRYCDDSRRKSVNAAATIEFLRAGLETVSSPDPRPSLASRLASLHEATMPRSAPRSPFRSDPDAPPISAGHVLCGRYRVLEPLGAGGMASVWRGEQLSTGLLVAVKIILNELLDTPGALVRFQSEARAVAQLHSRHVVRLIDYDVDPTAGPFIVMELLEGENLGDRIVRGGTVPPHEFAAIVTQVAKGLDHAHASGIVHRDLKPDNIFLVRDDEDGKVVAKLVDFGVAKVPLSAPSGLTSRGLLVGTIAYMSPEQAMGKVADKQSDLWALGVIAYQVLVGQVPFQGASTGATLVAICAAPMPVPSKANPALPVAFDDWFAKACSRQPDDRFTSAAELAGALTPIFAQREPPRTAQPTTGESYYIHQHDLTVGPVSGAILKRGLVEGRIPVDALVWRDGWDAWRSASTLNESLAIVPVAPMDSLRPGPGLEAFGPPSIAPVQAPTARPPRDPSDPLSSETDSGESYYVSAGDTNVGPVSRDLLLRGIETGRVPESALVWREGWRQWRPARIVRAWLQDGALLAHPVKKTPEFFDRPGLEAIGTPSILPRAAPASGSGADNLGPDALVFHVSDGTTTIGPISGTLLCRGVVAQRVPSTAMVWREGWEDWRDVAEVVWELAGVHVHEGAKYALTASLQTLGPASIRPPGSPVAKFPRS